MFPSINLGMETNIKYINGITNALLSFILNQFETIHFMNRTKYNKPISPNPPLLNVTMAKLGVNITTSIKDSFILLMSIAPIKKTTPITCRTRLSVIAAKDNVMNTIKASIVVFEIDIFIFIVRSILQNPVTI